MFSVVAVAVLWTLFFATHIGLATGSTRSRLVDRFGEQGFVVLFSIVASVCTVALVVGYALVRSEGPPGLAMGRFESARVLLYGAVGFGIVLMIAGIWRYPSSNYAMGRERVRQAFGLNRITRHPFFVGLAIVGLAHVLLAPLLVGAIFMAGFAVVSLVGLRHQDRKLAVARGRPYEDFLESTSIVPFAAILSGRQRLVWAELPRVGAAAGLIAVFAIRFFHDGLFAWYGAPVMLVTLGGAWFFLAKTIWASPRPAPSGSSSLDDEDVVRGAR